MTACPVCDCEEWTLISEILICPGNRYLRCCRCRSGYVEKAPTALELEKSYEDYYSFEGSYESSWMQKESRHITRLAGWQLKMLRQYKEAGRMLDIGSGRGEFLNEANKTGYYECVGVELSSKAADLSRKRFGLEVFVAPFHPGLFPDRKFDVVYMRHVIEHIEKPREFLESIRSICNPGAVVVVHLPNDLSITNAFKRFIYPVYRQPECGSLTYPYHLVGYNADSLRLLFESVGYEHLKTRTRSKLNRHYDGHFEWIDLAMLPFSVLDALIQGKGHVIGAYFKVPERA